LKPKRKIELGRIAEEYKQSGKIWGKSERHFISGGEGGRERASIVRRFPGNAHSSF
jgi:hypothetical protein